jgi:hypothetical protein
MSQGSNPRKLGCEFGFVGPREVAKPELSPEMKAYRVFAEHLQKSFG